MTTQTQYNKKRTILRQLLIGSRYFNALRAMEFAQTFHTGTRKDGVTPEFDHQVSIALLAHPRSFISQLLEQAPAGTVFIKADGAGGLALFDDEEADYRKLVPVWGCWGDDDYDVVAKHLTSGRIVFQFNEEGHDTKYFAVTPNMVEELEPYF